MEISFCLDVFFKGMVGFLFYVSWSGVVVHRVGVSYCCNMDDYVERFVSQSMEDGRGLTLLHGIVC